MVEFYEQSFAHAGLSLQHRSGGAAMIHGDAALIQRTLSNLLDNELKHTLSGTSVVLTVRNEHNKVVLRVDDDGVGLPGELTSRLFERYAKGERSSGHELGLAFVLAVVWSHDGQVQAHNNCDGGASIMIELPVAIHHSRRYSMVSDVNSFSSLLPGIRR